MGCKKAQGFLGKAGAEVSVTVDARKERYEGSDALAVLDGIDRLVVSRGKSFVIFDLKKNRPAEDVLLAHLLGPSGNLRAPTARVGKTLVVGFNEEAYRNVLD
jgi:hypothetical protein